MYGDILQGIGRAHNIYGYGGFSPLNTNGAVVFTTPLAMNAPTLGSLTTASLLEVVWQPITLSTQTGGEPILSYSLEQWNGTAFVSLIGDPTDSLLLYFNVTGVSVGTSYQFRLRALNTIGWGPYSSVVSLTPVDVPV